MKEVKTIGITLELTGLVLLGLAILFNLKQPFLQIFGIGGGVIFFAGLICFAVFWKCPSCEKHLPFRGQGGVLRMEYCPYCGEKIE